MDDNVDHYLFLGLPSGEEGSKLSEKEITKAYRLKALELHPDKRPDDPNAPANFQKLQTSYHVLKDEKARKLFDDLLRAKRHKLQRDSQQDSKRRRMMSDLEERERSFFTNNSSAKARSEEDIIARKLKEEINRIRAMHANKMAYNTPNVSPLKKESVDGGKSGTGGGVSAAEKETMLKVSWETSGVDYTAQRLRELFETIGSVKDVVIRSSKKKRSALIVMATKEAAVAATGTVLGDYSNPLLVIPLQPAGPTDFRTAREPVKPDPQLSADLVGTRYQAFEDSVLQKLQKAAERQK
ncbi:uncharacterized protein [Rutidosis leptorrhynchoides]|uniref:uncharacterized protein n=1 Tax=Rutidosis leptorrhynchoides TaxID=125765 RepID=UPI003A9A24FB